MTPECVIKVNTPAELIAAVPYLIGFHPAESVAVVALRGRRIIFAARYDLPDLSRPAERARGEAVEVAKVVASQGVTAGAVIGYGVADHVTATVLRLATALEQAGVPVLDQLRVTDGRWWSYLCPDPECCSEQGNACLPPDSAIAAEATFAGAVALPDRAALVTQLAPVATVPSASAQKRLSAMYDREPTEPAFVRKLQRSGRNAIREAERRYRSGRRLTDAEVAWLGVLLTWLPVRDYAWERTGDSPWSISLWMDVLRRVEPPYVPAPAGLLGFAAWRAGQGALARVAIDRAIEQDPEYEMARLLNDFLQLGVHPEVVDGWPDITARAGLTAKATRPAPRRRQEQQEGKQEQEQGRREQTSGQQASSGQPASDRPVAGGRLASDQRVPGVHRTSGQHRPGGRQAYQMDWPMPGRAVVDEPLARTKSRPPKRRGPRRRAV